MNKEKVQEKMIQLSFEIANLSQSIQVYEQMRSEKIVVYQEHHKMLSEILKNEMSNEKDNAN